MNQNSFLFSLWPCWFYWWDNGTKSLCLFPASPFHCFLEFPSFCRNKLLDLSCCQHFPLELFTYSLEFSKFPVWHFQHPPLSLVLIIVSSLQIVFFIAYLYTSRLFVESQTHCTVSGKRLHFRMSTHFLLLGLCCEGLRSSTSGAGSV